jgi:N-acetylneuraminate synthase
VALDVVAYTLGAKWIERHFTKDRSWKGTDHVSSLDFKGMKELVKSLNETYEALNFKSSEILPIEQIQRNKLKNRKKL